MNQANLKNFGRGLFNEDFKIDEIKGDASNRRYYRLSSNKKSFILMDSSRENRNFTNFLKFSSIFEKHKINIPKILKRNMKENLLIVEDFGDNLIYKKCNPKNFNQIYEKSVQNICDIQKIAERNIYLYKKEKYLSESSLFLEWVLIKFLDIKIPSKDKNRIMKEMNTIVNNIDHKNYKLVHRDYHSKNIFYKNGKIVVIDYQDAVLGSPLYDLVSLLNDCYRDINYKQKNRLKNLFLEKFNSQSKKKLSSDELLHNFDILSIQRHMKASGIFCRLSKKNSRHGYLKYLKRTFDYIINASSNYTNLKTINFYANEAKNQFNESNNFSSR